MNILKIQNSNVIYTKNSVPQKPINKDISQTNTKNPLMTLPGYAASISFTGSIKPAQRLFKAALETPAYIAEIFKARYFYGDRAVIELGMGNPDILPSEASRKTMVKKIGDLWSHRYNFPKGEWDFRKGVTDWMDSRFGVKIDPGNEVMMSAGASDGVDMIFTAYMEKGDGILIPDPGYTLYKDLISKHDLKGVPFDLKAENGYLPDLDAIKPEELKSVKAIMLNYPHNPTGAFAPLSFYEKAVAFAKKHNLFIIHDFDNSEVTHYGDLPIGILNAPGAKDVAFQVHTLSKAHSMPGHRIGFVVSNKEFIDNLLKAKHLSNNSVYSATQASAVTALKDTKYIAEVNSEYRLRKNTAIARLRELGSTIEPTKGTYYLWQPIPPGFTTDEFVKYVLHKAKVAFTPGTIYGKNGEGFVRIVMSSDTDILNTAFDQIEKAGIRFDTPKWELPQELQDEIGKFTRGEINIVAKYFRDLAEYKKVLQTKMQVLEEKLKERPDLKAFLPVPQAIEELPPFIFKDRQFVYLKNLRRLKPCFGEVREITPFSKKNSYDNLREVIAKTWGEDETPRSEILKMYREGHFYPDATYFTMFAENKLQGIVNLEIQNGELWVRGLNTAPWNQGKKPQIQGVGTALMARAMSFCLETGNKTLNLAPNSSKVANFYKAMGFKEAGSKEFNGISYPVLSIDTEGMKKFLEGYQRYLSY